MEQHWATRHKATSPNRAEKETNAFNLLWMAATRRAEAKLEQLLAEPGNADSR